MIICKLVLIVGSSVFFKGRVILLEISNQSSHVGYPKENTPDEQQFVWSSFNQTSLLTLIHFCSVIFGTLTFSLERATLDQACDVFNYRAARRQNESLLAIESTPFARCYIVLP